MVWLAAQMWVLLLIAFGLGLGLGIWLFPRRAGSGAQASGESEQHGARGAGHMARAPAARAHAMSAGRTQASKPAATMTEPSRPTLHDGPVEGAPDRLQKISGIGPKYERLLNEMGIYYYRQIAGWNDAEIAWLDRHLTFPGRIRRDKWPEQARLLMLSTSFSSGEPAATLPEENKGA